MPFPDAIDEFRTFTNLPGMTYDAAKTDIPFAEDLNKIVNATIAIEEALGVGFLNIWPIGSIYTTIGGSATTPPFSFGTWVITAIGRMEVGQDVNDVQFDTIEETGGAKTHTLSVNEMPSHRHNLTVGPDEYGWATPNYVIDYQYQSQTPITDTSSISLTGGGQAHNNLPPYYVVRKWKRTA